MSTANKAINTTALGRVVSSVLNAITRTVAAGRPVRITHFGTFKPVVSDARHGWNLHTKERINVPERQGLRFKPSPQFLDAVHAGDPEAAVITKRSRG
ncbi:HU family DNA-binding protein [Streptomyces indicus]|uniref:DNA-binding protein HU-beta n=1 Tax=Streptomyces indicus TaxID=417292 RepID=A0A1G8ZWD7_9ACTN|nr:HU family DNA-binding protein [Streptomyces indicus]SDK19277.1 DNA-binding protein HU-beta [Streptomyces indicus]